MVTHKAGARRYQAGFLQLRPVVKRIMPTARSGDNGDNEHEGP